MAFATAAAATVELARYWWVFILRGVLAIIFGIIAFVSPPTTIAVLVLLFGAWALVDGAFHIAGAVTDRSRNRSTWLSVLEGVISIIVGILALVFPDVVATSILLLISAWAIVTGVVEIVMAIRLREQITGELWLAIAGILSIVFGVLLFLYPSSGAITIVWIIGTYAIIFGIALIVLGWRLRGISQRAPAA